MMSTAAQIIDLDEFRRRRALETPTPTETPTARVPLQPVWVVWMWVPTWLHW